MADVLRLLSHIAQPPTTSLFPYTTLFRSRREERRVDRHVEVRHARRVRADRRGRDERVELPRDRKSTRLNSSHSQISYAVFCLKQTTTCTSPDETLHARCPASLRPFPT